MPNPLRASEAATLALHAALLVARETGRLLSTSEMASTLGASEAHLSKVLQALERTGIVSGRRGPGGGFRLARPARDISLKQVYESVEDPLVVGKCMFGVATCAGDSCPLGPFSRQLESRLVDKLTRTKLSDIRMTLGG